MEQDTNLDTFPRLLQSHVKLRPEQDAIREKDLGIWQSWTWAEAALEIRALACGLASLGLKRGEKLAIIGDNRPRLYWAMTAAQALGAVPVPLYQDAVADEMAYVLDNADVKIALIENQEQVDKLLEIRERCPFLEHIIYDETRGLRHYDYPFLHDFEQIQRAGVEFDQKHEGFYEREVAAGYGGEVAIMLYTSGTTGKPKGVVLSNDNVIVTARNGIIREGLTSHEEVLAYLPMAWVGDNLFSYAQSYVAGFCVSCPENATTVANDLREIGPTYYFAPPAIYENMLTQVLIRMEDAAAIKRKAFDYFMAHARRVGVRILNRESVSVTDKLLYRLGDILIYGPLKDVLGLRRTRLAYTAGEAIGPDIFDFYRSLGINIKQLYGQTECMVFICVQPDGEVYADTVGTPAIDVEIEIDDNGEIMYRSPGVFQTYYKNPEATASTKSEDGWVHTGDAGYFDDATGHLKIIDRAKDVGKLRDGTLFAPKYLENKLKFFSFIKEAVLFGSDRDFSTAFINIDLDAVGNWAERRNIAYSGYIDLAGQPEVYDLIKECVGKVNRDVSEDRRLANSQIRRFLILHKELDADDGELTRTRKVRRSFVGERFGKLVEALYSNQSQCHIDTEVTYEDGRTGRLSADVRIVDAEVYTSPAATRDAAA
jgi:long-chain acyl-CoA synthetase